MFYAKPRELLFQLSAFNANLMDIIHRGFIRSVDATFQYGYANCQADARVRACAYACHVEIVTSRHDATRASKSTRNADQG